MATFLTMRYGPRGTDGLRPHAVNLSSPLWLLEGPPVRVQRERLLKEAVQEGALVDDLGGDPVSFVLKLLLRPTEQPGTRSQDVLNRVRRAMGEEMALEIGNEDWGDGWYIEELREVYRKFNLPPDTGTAAARTHGGIAVIEVVVDLGLVKGTSGQQTVGLATQPLAPVDSDEFENL